VVKGSFSAAATKFRVDTANSKVFIELDVSITGATTSITGSTTVNGLLTVQDSTPTTTFSVQQANGNTFIKGNLQIGTTPTMMVDVANQQIKFAGSSPALVLKPTASPSEVFKVTSEGDVTIAAGGSITLDSGDNKFKVDSSGNVFAKGDIDALEDVSISQTLTVQDATTLTGQLAVTTVTSPSGATPLVLQRGGATYITLGASVALSQNLQLHPSGAGIATTNCETSRQGYLLLDSSASPGKLYFCNGVSWKEVSMA
jgi:hypothetical protein